MELTFLGAATFFLSGFSPLLSDQTPLLTAFLVGHGEGRVVSLAVRACDLKWPCSPGVFTALAGDLGRELGSSFLGKPRCLILAFCLSVSTQFWHKACFHCETCKMTLNMKNYKGYEKKPYCNA